MQSILLFLFKLACNIISFITFLLPNKLRRNLAILLGSIIYYLWKSRRKMAEKNLRLAFPNKSEKEIKSIARKTFSNLSITLSELFMMSHLSDEQLHKLINYENLELINEVKSRGRGVIFLSGHFGNWELLAYSVGAFTQSPVTIIVKPQRNTLFDNVINNFRTSWNNKLVSMYSAARTIISVVTKGEAIALLADQSATKDKDFFVDFFGRPAATYKAVADLALRFRIPIVMGFAVRQKDGSYSVKLKEVDFTDLENNRADALELTRRHVKILENAITENPDHWAWMHNRWKHQPR